MVWDQRSKVDGNVAAHDSQQSFKIAWIDEKHVATIGHMACSRREVKVFDVNTSHTDGVKIQANSRLALDISPAIMFPHYVPAL